MHLSSESLPTHLPGHYCVKRLSCSSKLTSLSVQPPPAPSTVTRIVQSSQQFKQSRLPATVQSIQLKVADPFQIYWGRSRRKGSRLPAVTVQAQPHKSLFVPKWAREHQSRDEALGHSLYVPNPKLPPDGKTRLREDELCDPMTRSCQTPMHTWESQCRACSGTGDIRSTTRGGKRTTSTCPLCSGVGVLRRTSSRIMPDVGNGNNGKTQYTLARTLDITSDSDDD